MRNFKYLLLFALVIAMFAFHVFGQNNNITQETARRYEIMNSITNSDDRRSFFGSQDFVMRSAIMNYQIDVKTAGVNLTPEQREAIAFAHYITTPRFYELAVKYEKPTVDIPEFHDFNRFVEQARKAFPEAAFRDIFGTLGDQSTLKKRPGGAISGVVENMLKVSFLPVNLFSFKSKKADHVQCNCTVGSWCDGTVWNPNLGINETCRNTHPCRTACCCGCLSAWQCDGWVTANLPD